MPKIDLAYTEEEMKERAPQTSEMPSDYKGPKYPWGLTLQFENDTLEKLGKTVSDFKIGEDMTVPVTLRVTGLSAREQEDGESRQSVDLIMTSVDLGGAKSDKERAQTLFGGED